MFSEPQCQKRLFGCWIIMECWAMVEARGCHKIAACCANRGLPGGLGNVRRIVVQLASTRRAMLVVGLHLCAEILSWMCPGKCSQQFRCTFCCAGAQFWREPQGRVGGQVDSSKRRGIVWCCAWDRKCEWSLYLGVLGPSLGSLVLIVLSPVPCW